jgi:tripartite-type tricarboxylate transporter receptor subunit TctC
MIRRRLALMAGLFAFAINASAQAWPAKPIHLIVAYPPGGSTDLLARLLAQKMAPALGQPIIIDNKPGATGQIGTAQAAKSEPDGYTLLFTNAGPGAVAYGLQKSPSYDPVRDFSAIATVANMPLLLAVGGGSRFAAVADLVAYGRANPGKLNYASTGNGSVSHIATELFDSVAKMKVNHVPYKGGAQSSPAVISGEVDYFFSVPSDILPQVAAGRMKALAFATAKRTPLAPEVPTMAEAGVPGFEVDVWYGLLGPKGLPRAIVDRLSREVTAALALPDVRERIAGLASVPLQTTPAQFGAMVAADVEKWTKVIRDNHIVGD